MKMLVMNVFYGKIADLQGIIHLESTQNFSKN